MRRSLLLLCAALTAAASLCACGGGGSPPHGHSSSPARSSSPSHVTSTAACGYQGDTVSAAMPLVQIQPPGAPLTTDTTSAPTGITCGTVLTVAQGGTADMHLSGQAECQVQQYDPATGESAKLVTRDPLNVLFRVADGHLVCTFGASPQLVPLCSSGTMNVGDGGVSQASVNCADPFFQVAVRAGNVQVTDPSGTAYALAAGQQLTYDFSTGQSQLAAAEFSGADLATFAAQAEDMSLTVVPIPQAITFNSTAPASPLPGDFYSVSATGGNSGNQVMYSIDPATTGNCTIKGSTVMFVSAGPCTIDANQAGNTYYAAAPQQQQTVDVQTPPS